MNNEDEEDWNKMIQKAKDMGATDTQILQFFGEYQRTPNIYDRQAEWVCISHQKYTFIANICPYIT